jgi:hypothetical protein
MIMVQILTGAAAGQRSSFIMPNASELRQLSAIVYSLHPKLNPANFADWRSEEAARDRKDFHDAFLALGRLGRLSEPEKKNPHSAGWWAAYLTDILGDLGLVGEVRTHVMVAAIWAHGDIPTCAPVELKFGLTIGTGIPAKDAWRKVLSTGALLPPCPPSEGWGQYRPGNVSVLETRNQQIGLISSVRR